MATQIRTIVSASSGRPVSNRVPGFVFCSALLCVLASLLGACSEARVESARDDSSIFVDDFGDTLDLSFRPTRITSLTPASTELLFALGAGNRVVGRTRWDIWPDSALLVADVGDGIRPNVEAVLGTSPDLVLLYASNDNRTSARQLRAAGVRTLSLKVDLPAEFVELTLVLGKLLGDTTRAADIADSVTTALDRVRARMANAPRPRVVWVADLNPLVIIGGGSFLSDLINIGGGTNIYDDIRDPSVAVSLEDLFRRAPDLILAGASAADHIRSEPAWSSLRAVREGRIVEADSWLLGRPSVRLGEAAEQMARMIHPELHR